MLLGVIALAIWGLAAQRRASKALASSSVGRALSLQGSNPAQALAYLAQAIREEPASVPAQSLLTDLLLYRSWPRPAAELRREDAEWVQLSDDGHLFVAASKNGGKIRIWDTQTLRKVGEVQQGFAIKSIEISRDGRRLLVVSPDVAELWDVQSGRRPKYLDLKDEAIPRLSPDGRWLAWIRDRQVLILRDNETNKEREIINRADLDTIGFSPDSRKIFAEDSKQVFLWDIERNRSLQGPQNPFISDVTFSYDSRHLLVIASSSTIIWNLEEGEGRQIAETAVRGWLDFGGKKAALYSPGGKLSIWSTEIGYPYPLLTLPMRDLFDAKFSREGRFLLTVSDAGVELWNLASGHPVSQAFCECLHGSFLAETRQIVTGDDNGVLRVWSPEPTTTGTELYRASRSPDLHFAFSSDGGRFAVRTRDKVHLWDMGSVRRLRTSTSRPGRSSWFKLSPDGRFLYEGRYGQLQIGDFRAEHPKWLSLDLSDEVLSEQNFRTNRANEVLGVRSDAHTVQLWSLTTGKRLATTQQKQAITDFAFSPSGDLVTTSANSVFVWGSQTGKPLREVPHESPVTSFDFSPDHKLIVTGTEYGLVRIWDLASGRSLVGSLRHRDEVSSVRFELGGRLLLTSAHNLLRLWETRKGQPASPNIRAVERIDSAQLGADGTRILINSAQEPIRLLDAHTGQLLFRTFFLSSGKDLQARLSSTDQILWVASGDRVHVFAVPRFPEQDRELLARWAEAVGGWAVGEDGQLVELSDQLERLETLRRETADAPPGQLRAASLIRWFLSDPKTRPVSPIFERTIIEPSTLRRSP